MAGPGRDSTRCPSPRKYSRKRGPHHVYAHLSFPRPFRHSPEHFIPMRGVLSPRRRESSPCRPSVSWMCRRGCRLLLKHRRDGCKFVRYWKNEWLPNSQQSPFRWISSGGDRGTRPNMRPCTPSNSSTSKRTARLYLGFLRRTVCSCQEAAEEEIKADKERGERRCGAAPGPSSLVISYPTWLGTGGCERCC